jgi:glucose-6-phosphate isomerase
MILKAVFAAEGVSWPGHFVAVTGSESDLDRRASKEGWLARFPMWDWVGGRTSELSAVGLLPAALQGLDIRSMLRGAAYMDQLTRHSAVKQNPAMWLALAWYHIGDGKGHKDMVVLPYKDRLQLMSRYLQQLVMESLGKFEDRLGNVVKQGIAVYGNKGSTDQHAYVQQLRDGVENFFATFIQVLEDGGDGTRGFGGKLVIRDVAVEPGVTAGDYLFGFLYGTREALSERGRRSITLAIKRVDEFCLGQLIALFERAVGFYASFVNINAYHQPGVEAGKKAAASILEVADRLRVLWQTRAGETVPVDKIGELIAVSGKDELLFHLLRRAAANGQGALSVDGAQSSFTFFAR